MGDNGGMRGPPGGGYRGSGRGGPGGFRGRGMPRGRGGPGGDRSNRMGGGDRMPRGGGNRPFTPRGGRGMGGLGVQKRGQPPMQGPGPKRGRFENGSSNGYSQK